MASRVNIKFVIILAVGLIVVAGGTVGLAALLLIRTGDQLVAEGDKAISQGDLLIGKNLYRRAVRSKEPWNREWIGKWQDALEQIEAQTQGDFIALYGGEYFEIHERIVNSFTNIGGAPEDLVKAQLTYLDLLFEDGGLERALTQAETYIVRHESDPMSADAGWERLKRYPAMIRARRVEQGLEFTLAQIDESLADAEAALAENRGDWQAGRAWTGLRLAQLSAVLDRPRTGYDVEEIRTSITAHLDALAEQAPMDDPVARAFCEGTRISGLAQLARVEARALPARDRRAFFEETTEELAAQLPRVEAAVAAIPATDITSRLLALYTELRVTLDRDSLDKVIVHGERAIEANPGDAELLWTVAITQELHGEFEGAKRVLTQLAELPNPTIGREGRATHPLRLSARQKTGEIQLSQAVGAEDDATREEMVAAVRRTREELAGLIPENDPLLLLLDGRIALLLDEDPETAQAKLREFNAANTNNVDGLWLAGLAAQQLNQPGEARRMFQQVLQLRPGFTQARLALANIEASLRQYDEALLQLREAAATNPDNEIVQARIVEIEELAGERSSDDPVRQALLDADRLIR
ncbi:MAG: tetratricopeptide repeat protein, partial [Planctomycetota bacterium]